MKKTEKYDRLDCIAPFDFYFETKNERTQHARNEFTGELRVRFSHQIRRKVRKHVFKSHSSNIHQ